MIHQSPESQTTTKLMLRLLLPEVMIAVVSAVNSIISSLFASNFVGVGAVSVVQLYSPVQSIIAAFSIMMIGGSHILCGKYMGKNQLDQVQRVFSLNLVISLVFSVVVILLLVCMTVLNMSWIFNADEEVRVLLDRYLLGQATGILPIVISQQMVIFLLIQGKGRRVRIAGAVFILINLALNYLFVVVINMDTLGLALAPSFGAWAMLIIEVRFFLSDKSRIRISFLGFRMEGAGEIMKIGLPGSLSQGYQTVRGIVINTVVLAFVGTSGLSAFGAASMLLALFWALPSGMLTVSRILMSISIGEEDRITLTSIMRTMFLRFVPIMCIVSIALSIFAKPFTMLYYRDPADPVFMMTVAGFRLLPLCMPFSIVCMHFVCYGQASNKQFEVHLLSLLDGVACVALFTALLVPRIGINGLYLAHILNGVVTTIVIIMIPWIKHGRFPNSIEALMDVPEDFGVPENDRLDISLNSMEEVINISERIQEFCLSKGAGERRAYLAGLSMEEMAGNVVEHGFCADDRKHSVDVRVIYKEGDIILRIRDDCAAFDPAVRQKIVDPDDITSNIGIRMVYKIAKDITYQNIMGLNVLTIKI